MSPGNHEWVRRRLAAVRAGLLEPGEEKRLRAHLRECKACHEAYEQTSEAGEGRHEVARGHIPPPVLARWRRASRTLGGLERALVRSHLIECAECRQDLEVLGHAPVPDTISSVEVAPQALVTVKDPAEAGKPGPGADRGRSSEARRRRQRPAAAGWQSVLSGWQALMVPVLQFRPTRSGGMVAAATTIDEETSAVALPVDVPARVPPEAHVVVEIMSPDGALILSERRRTRELTPPRFLVLMSPGKPLAPGVYRLRLRGDEPPIADVAVERSFELRLVRP